MSTIRRRLKDVEDRQAFRDWQDTLREFESRSTGELEFFAMYGYFPDSLGGELPERQELTVAGIRIITTAEWIGTPGLTNRWADNK